MPSDIQFIENFALTPLQVWLEPWAESVEIEALCTAEFRASSDADGCLEIVWTNDGPVVYGWTGSVLSVMVEQQEIWTSYAPAPNIGRSLQMSDVIRLLFCEP